MSGSSTEDRDAGSTAQQVPFRKLRDGHDWIDLYGRLVLAAAAALIAASAFWFQWTQGANLAEERMRAKATEIQRRYEALRDARRTNQVLVSTALVPIVVNGAPSERRHALMALARLAPRVLLEIAAVAQERAANETERQDVLAARLEASSRELAVEFPELLRLARDFRAAHLNEEACAAFRRSWDRLPDGYDIDYQVIKTAQARCGSSPPNAGEGAEHFQLAFQSIQTH